MDSFNERTPLKGSEDSDDEVSGNGCFCFEGFCLRRRRNGDDGDTAVWESWWAEKAKMVREVSEVLAGPKWKNWIRRLSFYGINCSNKKMMRRMKFQYDLQSYKLNFDEGFAREEDDGFPDLSSRFPPTPPVF